jgi:hypothetical protein
LNQAKLGTVSFLFFLFRPVIEIKIKKRKGKQKRSQVDRRRDALKPVMLSEIWGNFIKLFGEGK